MSESGSFAVELPVFTGPFKLLADLIMEQKVDVCDVPVARVTDGFLAYAKEAQNWTLEEATWFLAICAALLELKVVRLMPSHEMLDDEQLESPDIAYARSLELAAFRQMALDFAGRIEANASYFSRDVGPAREFADLYPDFLEKVTAGDLAEVAAALLRVPAGVDLSHVTPIRITVAEAIEQVEERLSEMRAANFRELVADCEERIYVVVRFLALLELYRSGRVDLEQADTFGEITVRWQG